MNRPVDGWDPMSWDLHKHLPLDSEVGDPECVLSASEELWINAWDDFVRTIQVDRGGRRLPGFPLWADEWKPGVKTSFDGLPVWKVDFIKKNREFYLGHKRTIDNWTKRWKIYSDAFPASRRKLEWQAQDTPSLWETVLHFRPSGIRAKAPTYLPALVAITQTSVIGPERRRLSPREAARLQGLPDWFDFGQQSPSSTYRQLGNGVSVGAVWYVLQNLVSRDRDILKKTCPRIVSAIETSPRSPDEVLESHARRVA